MQFGRAKIVITPHHESFLRVLLPLLDLAKDLVLVRDQSISDQRLDTLHDDRINILSGTAHLAVILQEFELRRPPTVLPSAVHHLVGEVPEVLIRLRVGVHAQITRGELQLPLPGGGLWRERSLTLGRQRLGWLRYCRWWRLGCTDRARVLRGRGDHACGCDAEHGETHDGHDKLPFHEPRSVTPVSRYAHVMGRLPPRDQEVQEVSDVLREEAVVLAFGGSRMRAQRVLERPRDPSREAVLVLRDDKGRLQHAAVLARAPGRTALLTMSPLRGAADRPRGALLVREAIVTAQRMDAAVVQALVEPLAKDDLAAMESGGMHHIATLAYLERAATRECRPLPPAHSEIRISPWDGRQRDMLESLLSMTYVDSLDCPGLAELRSTRDILDGHLSTGVLDSRLWLLLEWRGETVGACFISEIPSSRCMELVYFGLIPRARGIGLGRVLLDHALALLKSDLRGPVALACDERNTPAMRLYASRGFAPRLRRAALVCKVATARQSPH